MSIAQPSARFDSLRPAAKSSKGTVEYCDFDCDAIDTDDTEPADDSVTLGDASSALMKILYWAADARGSTPQEQLAMVGARIQALLWLLNPGESRFQSLSDLARVAGCTKQSISKAVVRLREDTGFCISAVNSGAVARFSARRLRLRLLRARTGRRTSGSAARRRKMLRNAAFGSSAGILVRLRGGIGVDTKNPTL
jgi:biotin operon repressor